MNERESPAVRWEAERLDVPRIESELARLRGLAGGSDGGGALRTNLSNMVIYTESDAAAAAASEAIDQLSGQHPSRALVLVADESGLESSITTTLMAHCHSVPGLEQGVCCEEVMLHLRGRVAGHLHSVIAPLLLPDLPVNVWWAEELTRDKHAFSELIDAADRFIVDSERFEDQPEGLRHLYDVADGNARRALGDLAWSRVEGWCDVFRSQRQVADVRHHLSSVQSLELRYAAGSSGSAQSYLLLAWLGRQLGWSAAEATVTGDGQLAISHGGRDIDVYLVPVPYDAVPPGWIVSIKISCESATSRALLTMSRTGDPELVTIRTEHRDSVVEDHLRFDRCEPGALLVRQMECRQSGQPYSRTLRDAISLVRAPRR